MIQELFDREGQLFTVALAHLNLPEESKILDIGCADLKPYSQELIRRAATYTGVDLDESCLATAKAKSKEPKVSFAHMSAENLTYADQSFDLVVFNNALAYTDKLKAIGEAYRVLKPGGVFLSYFNNTIGYSINKIFRRVNKPFLVEVVHSLVVIVNTFFYKITGKKFFRTTYSTLAEFNRLFAHYPWADYRVIQEDTTHRFAVLNVVARK